MSTEFQTLCRKPRSIQMSSFEDMSVSITTTPKHTTPGRGGGGDTQDVFW